MSHDPHQHPSTCSAPYPGHADMVCDNYTHTRDHPFCPVQRSRNSGHTYTWHHCVCVPYCVCARVCAQALPPPPPAEPAPPSAPAASGGPKELVKRAQLRDVHVSVALMEEFLAYARNNTLKGIESCGILAGRLSACDSTFTICTLIIPKQQGTTDTVQVGLRHAHAHTHTYTAGGHVACCALIRLDQSAAVEGA